MHKDRQDQIERIVEITKSSRELALELGFNFEAYLLELAIVSLADRLSNEN